MNPNCFEAKLFGDDVWFILNDFYKQFLPADAAIIYTLEEAQILAKKSEAARRMAHEAKKSAGAVVKLI